MSQLVLTAQTITDPVTRAIERLRAFEPSDGYWLGFSGGKDSSAIYHLAVEAGVRFEAHYNVTTADPPEVVRFIKSQYPEVAFDLPECNIWALIARERCPFTRLARYCCRALKERGGEGRLVVTGVRWSESNQRSHRQMVEPCKVGNKRFLHPIIDWSEADVWRYLGERPHCSLYDEGYTRIGCVACPQKGAKRQREGPTALAALSGAVSPGIRGYVGGAEAA